MIKKNTANSGLLGVIEKLLRIIPHVYLIFRPNGPEGAWAYYNLIFLLGLILSIYDTTFYLKGIDTETGAKNSITDLIIGAFTLAASIILIIGLSDKIYI